MTTTSIHIRTILFSTVLMILCSCGGSKYGLADRAFQKRKYLPRTTASQSLPATARTETRDESSESYIASTDEELIILEELKQEVHREPLISKPSKPKLEQHRKPKRVKQLKKKHEPKNYIEATEIEEPPKVSGVTMAGFISGMFYLFASILGGLGISFSFIIPLLGVFAGLAAFILGLTGLAEIKREPEKYVGKGYALTATILGSVFMLSVLIVLAFLIGVFSPF